MLIAIKINRMKSEFIVDQKIIVDVDLALIDKINMIHSELKKNGYTSIQISNDNAQFIVNDNKQDDEEPLEISEVQLSITREFIYWSGLIKDSTLEWETTKISPQRLYDSIKQLVHHIR